MCHQYLVCEQHYSESPCQYLAKCPLTETNYIAIVYIGGRGVLMKSSQGLNTLLCGRSESFAMQKTIFSFLYLCSTHTTCHYTTCTQGGDLTNNYTGRHLWMPEIDCLVFSNSIDLYTAVCVKIVEDERKKDVNVFQKLKRLSETITLGGVDAADGPWSCQHAALMRVYAFRQNQHTKTLQPNDIGSH